MLTRTSSAPQPLVVGTHGVSTPAPALAASNGAPAALRNVGGKCYAVRKAEPNEKNAKLDPPLWPERDSIFSDWTRYGHLVTGRSGAIHQSFTVAQGGMAAAEAYLATHGTGTYQRVLTPTAPSTPASAFQNAFSVARSPVSRTQTATVSSPSRRTTPPSAATLITIDSDDEEEDEDMHSMSGDESDRSSTEVGDSDDEASDVLQLLDLDAFRLPTGSPFTATSSTTVGDARAKISTGSSRVSATTAAARLPVAGPSSSAIKPTYAQVTKEEDWSWLDPLLMSSPTSQVVRSRSSSPTPAQT
ncbi:hypothetical protein P7C70_g7062, partial [Phenoliferia sp. Uapishka_3]